jgi:hypothetical protein
MYDMYEFIQLSVEESMKNISEGMLGLLGFITFMVVTVLAGIASLEALEGFGLTMMVEVTPYRDGDGDWVTESWTSPGYACILFGMSVGVLVLMTWLEKKRSWVDISLAALGLVLTFGALVVIGLGIDTAFGFADGYHQIAARTIWLITCAAWVYAVYRLLYWFQRS